MVSYSSGFGLVVLAKEDIPAYFGDMTASLLLGDELSTLNKVTPDRQQLRKRMSGQTRSDWLKYVSKGVFDKIDSCDTLRFVSEERYTHTEIKQEGEEYGYEYQYTLIKGKDIDVILQDIDKFFTWCGANIQTASILINCSEGEVRDGVFNSFYCEDPNRQAPYGEDGDSGQFLFCVIKTIQALLFYAKNNNLYAVYINDQYTSLNQEEQPSAFVPVPITNEPRFFYEDGSPVQEGDAVMYDYGMFPAKVETFLYSGGQQNAVVLNDGRAGQPVVWDYAYTKGQFTLIERNTQDYIRACLNWLQHWVDAGNAHAHFVLGNLYRIGHSIVRDDNKAFILFQKAVEQGHPIAPHHLGGIYEEGTVVSADPQKAAELYRQSAEKGYAQAQCSLALAYHTGNGVVQDYYQAAQWYEKAAQQDNIDAQCNLGVLYSNGQGVPKDDSKAVELFRAAAEKGHAGAQHNLAWKYEMGEGTGQSYEEAVRWYKLAAAQGHRIAECNLADKYENGLGVSQDLKLALELYKKAADKNVLAAMFSLGNMYKDGRGVVQDKQEAIRWFKRAAELGYADAAASLAELQQDDFGEARAMLAQPGSYSTEAFYEQAMKIYKPGDNEALTFAFDLYRQAALRGHYEAQFQLAFMYSRGFGTRQNFANAASWYKKSAEQGYDEAQIALARLYETGSGVPKDLKMAKSWYEKAAKQGHPDAITNAPEKKQSSGFLSWVTNISVFFLVIITVYATGQSFIQDWQFSDHGQQALVEPIMQYEEVTRTQKKMGITTSETKSYNAEIKFTTSANERIMVRKGIPKEVLEKFVNDRPVYIKYLPEDPRTTRFPEEGSGSMLMLFFALVLCGVFYFLIRKR